MPSWRPEPIFAAGFERATTKWANDAGEVLQSRMYPVGGTRLITVIAHYRALPARAVEVRALLAQHSRSSGAEAGCIQFTALQDAADPSRFALYESYVDEAAFAAHRRTEHFRVNIEQTLVPMLVQREWRVYGAPLDEP